MPPATTRMRGWLTPGPFVITAQPVIQCLKRNSATYCGGWDGIARCARDTQPLCAGGSAPAPWVPCARAIRGPRPSGRLRRHKFDPVEFVFARAKKGTKESTPGSLHRAHPARSPARLASAGRSPNSPGAGKRATGSIRRRATIPGLARCSARDTGGLANHLRVLLGDIFRPQKRSTADIGHERFSGPRSARRVPQPARVRVRWSIHRSPVDFHAAERVRRGSAHPGHEGGSRALRGVLSSGFFSLHEQRKETSRGSATHKYASPQATQDQQRVRI